jgi:hypothetical protein
MFDRQSLLFFSMDGGLEVEVLQRHVGPPLLVDYMWSKHFSICQNINRDENSKRDVKADTNRIHYIQLYSKCAKIGLYERRTLNQFPACPEQ